jgi:hypothetical protein
MKSDLVCNVPHHFLLIIHKLYVSKGYKDENDFITTYAEHSIIIFSFVLFMLYFNNFECLKYFPTLARQFRRVKSAEKFHSLKFM